MSEKTRFLVAFDYGQGAVWAYLFARSAEEIRAEFPELVIVDTPPAWLTGEREARLRETMSLDIDERRVGWLADLIDGRMGDGD